MGARSQSLGYTSSCIKDEWALFNNVAGLSAVKNFATSVSYQAYPIFKSFNRMAAAISIPTRAGVIGAGVYRFGDKLYNEQIISAGFSNEFGIASLGVKVNYLQYEADGFGNTGAFTVSMGGLATITKQLLVGAYITNINQPSITRTDVTQTIPARLNAGIAFKPSEKVFLSTEIEKDISHDPSWKAGAEFELHRKFVMRTGLNVHPDAGFFGFGFKSRKFLLDYAVSYNAILNLTHQASISIRLMK